MRIAKISALDGHTVIDVDSGSSYIIRPSLDIFTKHCRDRKVPIIGNELGILSYEFMEKDWASVRAIYSRIGRAGIPGFKPPNTFGEFTALPFDVLEGTKEYMIYLTKEYAIAVERPVTWFYKEGRRCFVDHAKPVPEIKGELGDIISDR